MGVRGNPAPVHAVLLLIFLAVFGVELLRRGGARACTPFCRHERREQAWGACRVTLLLRCVGVELAVSRLERGPRVGSGSEGVERREYFE